MSGLRWFSIIMPLSALITYSVLAVLVMRRQIMSLANRLFALYLVSMMIWSGASLMLRLDAPHAILWSQIVTAGGAAVSPCFAAHSSARLFMYSPARSFAPQ